MSYAARKNGKIAIITLLFTASAALLMVILSAPSLGANTLFYYPGPDYSQHSLQLTDFRVEGPATPRVGDNITVSFVLSNFSQENKEFAEKGVFAAVRDPDNQDRSFGFTHENEIFELGENIIFSQSFVVDKIGEWRIWPSYQIWAGGFAGAPRHRENGPYEWHVCTLEVYAGKPDLEVYGITWTPENPTVGRPVSLKPLIRNIGKSASPNCGGTFYVNEVELASVTVPSIPAGKSLEQVGVVSAEWVPPAKGKYLIKFVVDSTNIIDEYNETNNENEVYVTVSPFDNTPPTVTVSHSPESPTEFDNVAFHVKAEDPSGIDFITLSISVGGSITPITRHDTTSFDYTGGPYPRKSLVKYCVQAADKASNIYLSPWENFRVRSFYTTPLTVNIERYPPEPTQLDNVTFTATASYPYGVHILRIYLNGTKVCEVENENICSITRGPWAPDTTINYYAEAYDVDGNYARTPTMSFTVERLRNVKNMISYSEREVFMISDMDWRAVLSLVPIAVWGGGRSRSPTKYPVLIYHEESPEVYDADAVIYFLQQYDPDHVTIFGDPPSLLVELLEATPPLGAGLRDDQITIWRSTVSSDSLLLRLNLFPTEVQNFREALSIKWNISITIPENGAYGVCPAKDILTTAQERRIREHYWEKLGVYVVCEDEYSTGLLASVYASIINAPLLFQGHYDLDEISGKYVYLIGSFTEDEVSAISSRASIRERFTFDELRQNFIRYYSTWPPKVILVNPLDLWIYARGDIYARGNRRPDKCPWSIQYLFSKHSLAAPFLAAAKGEIILSVPRSNYIEIDKAVKDFLDLLPSSTVRYLTIIASPEAIPIARPNFHYPVAFDGTNLYYETFNFNDTDIIRRNIYDNTVSYVTMAPGVQFNPAASTQTVAWRESGLLHYLTKGTEAKVAGDSNPSIYENIIVWEHGDDIYMYEVGTGTYPYSGDQITSTRNIEEKNPAIWGDRIVWQDNRNFGSSKWDICVYSITEDSTEILNIPGSQERPAIYDDKIAYMDDRNGNWEIYVCDLSSEIERRITNNDREQRDPRIYGNIVVWEDYRDGNAQIYAYDLATSTEMRITSGPEDHVLPVVSRDKIFWYERSESGWWYIAEYDLRTGVTRRIVRTEVSRDSGAWWLEVDGRYYGSSYNLEYQDTATGRIYGVTVSDVSAYIARDLFFDQLNKNRDALIVMREDHQSRIDEIAREKGIGDGWKNEEVLENYARETFWTDETRGQFGREYFYSGHDEVSTNSISIYNLYDDCYLLLFVDHGNTQGFVDMMDSGHLIRNQVYLQPSVVIDLACLTGSYNSQKVNFAVQNMRRGAMVYMGATDVSYWHTMFKDILYKSFIQGKTIGEAYLEARNNEYDESPWNFSLNLRGDIFYALHGDPTFRPRWW